MILSRELCGRGAHFVVKTESTPAGQTADRKERITQVLWPEQRVQKSNFTAEEAGSLISPAPVWPPCNFCTVYKPGPTAADCFQSPRKGLRASSNETKSRVLLQSEEAPAKTGPLALLSTSSASKAPSK